ncbi:MAG: prepilin-type N-terminal cleavage/methylation domain-containing protein [Microgenomates group bacterium]
MSKKSGFTLIEIVIVVAIVAILISMVIFGLTSNLAKSRDSKRKADLDRIKIALEDYYGDKGEYPTQDLLSTCDTESLKPYLSNIPCDPKTQKPYCYIYDTDSIGQNYRLLASLENSSDPIIETIGCNISPIFCGYETECILYGNSYNYGIASSNIVVKNQNAGGTGFGTSPGPSGSGAASSTPTPTPTPTASPSIGPLPSTIPGNYACRRIDHICRAYDNPTGPPHYCPITWADSSCNYYCDSVPDYGLCAD